jgi:pimeloyl-ACP methyl ester carboxylesterase
VSQRARNAVPAASRDHVGAAEEALPVEEVRAPAQLWYGDADWVGPEHGRWYAERLEHAHLTVVPGAGHLLPLTHWRSILDAAQAV